MTKSEKQPDLPNELPPAESGPNLPGPTPNAQNELPDSNGSESGPIPAAQNELPAQALDPNFRPLPMAGGSLSSSAAKDPRERGQG